MDKKVLIALIDSLVNEAISNVKVIEGQRGPRGLKGKDGNDFDIESHREELISFIHENLPTLELTEEQKDELRGLPGRDGKDGRDGIDFNLSDHTESIVTLIKDSIPPFELTDEMRIELKGDQGRPGKDGRDGEDFDFDSYREHISQIISNYISEISPSLKLTFKDLSEDEIFSLRGPRGQRGKPGKDFSLDEAKETIEQSVADSVMALAPDLKLKFEDLTDTDKDSLKLKFTDLTEDEQKSLRGPRGQRGKQGQPGLDGQDGSVWFTGKGTPTKEASKGDIYLDIDTGDVYSFIDSWKKLTNITGPQGERGVRGQIGPQGLKGLPGINGLDGRDGEDAPKIIAVETDQRGNEVTLIFIFDNGMELRAEPFDLPKAENIYNVYTSSQTFSNPFFINDVPCEISVYENSFVYIGNDGIARNALANDFDTSKVIGIVQSKPATNRCNIRVKGNVDVASISTSLLTQNDYWLSPTIPGGFTTVKPNKYQGYCVNLGQAIDNKTLFIDIGTRFINNDLMKTQALYNEASLASSSSTTLLTKTVDPDIILEIAQVKVNGENKGTYTLKIDGNIIEKVYTYYTDYKATLVYGDLVAEEGQVITLEVDNNSTDTANFNGTLFYREYEL